MVKTVIIGAVVAFLVFLVVTDPQHATKLADGTWHFVVHMAHSFRRFFDGLSS